MISYAPSPICSGARPEGQAIRGETLMAEPVAEHPKIGLLASGGAPNLHLIAGALCAFHEDKKDFKVIGASGAGALAGLLYAVPKDARRAGSSARTDCQP